VEISVFGLGVFFEKLRFDLTVRRWWSRLGLGPVVSARLPVPVALAGVDLRRLLLRPSTLFGLYVMVRILAPALPATNAYDGVNRLVGQSLGFVGVAVMLVLASVAGRDRGSEIVAALPVGTRSRSTSWLVLLLGLAVVEYVALALSRFGRAEPSYGALLPDAWELTQGPLLLVGGGLLGLLLARLLPAWVAGAVALVGSLLWVGLLSGTVERTTMLAPVIEWVQYHEDASVVTIEPGSFAWHNAFLLGLCGLAYLAVLLTGEGRRRALVVTGAVVLAATAVAGALALP
jgi:hypothetical protein